MRQANFTEQPSTKFMRTMNSKLNIHHLNFVVHKNMRKFNQIQNSPRNQGSPIVQQLCRLSIPSSRSNLRGGPLRSLSSRLSLRSRRSSLSRRRSSLSLSSRRPESLQLEASSAGPLLQSPSSLQ